MTRFPLILIVALCPLAARAGDTCSVSGTAYDFAGKPLADAVVRLLDTRTRQTVVQRSDARAAFGFTPVAAEGRYRIEVLSKPVRVTGTHIPTRSILGMSGTFGCSAGTLAQQDVRVQVD